MVQLTDLYVSAGIEKNIVALNITVDDILAM